MPDLSISVVSHRQIRLVESLLADIRQYCSSVSIEVILTVNVDEPLFLGTNDYAFPIRIIRNRDPKGFGENHNAAFKLAAGNYFCVLNPDIRLESNPFPPLFACLEDVSVGLAGPLVVGESGRMEDSARRFPTPLKIFCKAIGNCKGRDYLVNDEVIFPDWVGGMFMLFRREVYAELGGFDERYFLYYEDVDLCARLRLRGYEVALCPAAKVVHHAQRSSHRNLQYLIWHVASMLRFFLSSSFVKIYWFRIIRGIS